MTPRPRLPSDSRGSVSVEMALAATFMVLLTAGAVELAYAFQQHSGAQTAVRHGARLASTLSPASSDLSLRSVADDPFDITCSESGCSQGTLQSGLLSRVVFGPDDDGQCAATARERRGMCDLYDGFEASDVSIRYQASGLGGLDASANPAPIITVTIAERPLQTVVLGPLLPGRFQRLPAVSASTMGEDLDG